MHRLPFPKSSWKAKALQEFASLNNNRYFILFVDDFTRMMWVYFLKQKSKTFLIFCQFKVMVEKESGHILKILRIDRGGELL